MNMTGKTRLTRTDTGETVARHRNVILYKAADILARMLGGDASYRPSYIGFIYANKAYSGFYVPQDTDRHFDWEYITSEVEQANGNMIISPLTTETGYRPSGSDYEGNILTISAISDSSTEPIFSGPGFAGSGPAAGVDAYFQTVFMAVRYQAGQTIPQYLPYAYASINSDGTGVEVITSAEYQQHWDLTIK